MLWYPQVPPSAFQASAGTFLLLKKGVRFCTVCVFVNSCQHMVFVRTFENIKQTQNAVPAEQLSEFVMNSHLDLTGDQNDVQ